MQVDYGTTVDYKMVAFCRDSAAADEVLKDAEEDMKRESPSSSEADKERRRNAKLSKSGSTVKGTTSIKEQTLIDELNKTFPGR